MGCQACKQVAVGDEGEFPTPEARRLSLLCSDERPDLLRSLKLGLDPTAPIITQVYDFEEVLGRGAFGQVQRARHRESRRLYAIKMIPSSNVRQGSLRSEISILQECRHPNIIALREVYATEDIVYLVTELALGGALFDVIVRDGVLSEQLAAKVTRQLADALAFMHRAGVVHRDIKPENLLVADKDSMIIKICDFGLSKIIIAPGPGSLTAKLDDAELVMRSRVGTQLYASPELLTNQATYDQSIDIWGLGLVVYIILSGSHPFASKDRYTIINSRVGFGEPVWDELQPSAVDLVTGLLKVEPKERLTAEEVLSHPWLQEGLTASKPLEVSLAELANFQTRQVRLATSTALASSLGADEVAELKTVFDWIDVDRKGYLTPQDLENAIHAKAHALLGINNADRARLKPTTSYRYKLPLLLRRLKQRERAISFDEFVNAIVAGNEQLVRRHLTSVFGQYDPKGSGVIATEDLNAMLIEFGLDASELFGGGAAVVGRAHQSGHVSYDDVLNLFLHAYRQEKEPDTGVADGHARAGEEAQAQGAALGGKSTQTAHSSSVAWSTGHGIPSSALHSAPVISLLCTRSHELSNIYEGVLESVVPDHRPGASGGPVLDHGSAIEPLLSELSGDSLTDTNAPYTEYEGLIQSVESGSVAPLRGSWLLKLWESGGSLKRRQELPPDAFWTAAELRALVDAARQRFGSSGRDVEGRRAAVGLLFNALSYRWLAKGEPDPDRFHLQFVANFLYSYLGRLRPSSEDDGADPTPLTGSRFRSTPLKTELFDRIGHAGTMPDCAVFWDYGVLWQKSIPDSDGVQIDDRSTEQKAQFTEGLKASNLWYGHAHALTWLQPRLPEGFGGTSYAQSGWCFVEASISSVLKRSMRRVDVGAFMAYSDAALAMEVCASGTRPPVRKPNAVDAMLEGKTFFARTDVVRVAALYTNFFNDVVPWLRRLQLTNLQWGDAEAVAMADTLPSFKRLAVLNCSNNCIGPLGAEAISDACGTMPSLRALSLGDNQLGDDGVQAVAAGVAASRSLTILDLSNKSFKSARFGPRGAAALASSIIHSSSLKLVDLSHNNIGGYGDVEVTRTPEGPAVIAEALLMNSCVTECNLSHNSFGEVGWVTVFDTLRRSPQKTILTWRLSNEGVTPKVIQSLVAYVSAAQCLTSLDLSHNFGKAEDAAMLASAIAASPALTRLNVQGNMFGDEGERLLRKVAAARSDFELHLGDG